LEIDVLKNVPNRVIKCLDHGFVSFVDTMPRLVPEEQKTSDFAIVQAARVSYGDGTKTLNEDRGLLRYLMRHTHTTPFEMVEFKFHMKMPIFVARQIVRHRMASLNEVSGRYSVLKEEFYIPEVQNVKKQSTLNKQGGDETLEPEKAEIYLNKLKEFSDSSYDLYQDVLGEKVSREQSRMVLPVNLYTEWYWKIDLKNLLHFLCLRCDPHAQYETRVFADAILELITPIVPLTIEAWNDYQEYRGAIKLTRLEIEALKNAFKGEVKVPSIISDNKREVQEWKEKAIKLGLVVE
jgi:thymidylate synthase (FAD)